LLQVEGDLCAADVMFIEKFHSGFKGLTSKRILYRQSIEKYV